MPMTEYLMTAPSQVLSLPPDYPNLQPAIQKALKKQVKMFLDLTRQGKEMVYIGVTRLIYFKDGTEQGALKPGSVYHCAWHEYEALKLDSVRSSYVCLLDARKLSEVERACLTFVRNLAVASA